MLPRLWLLVVIVIAIVIVIGIDIVYHSSVVLWWHWNQKSELMSDNVTYWAVLDS